MKKCSKCKESKDESFFSRDKYRPDGLTSWCKACRSSLYQSKRESTLAQQKEYADKNRNVRRAYGREYYSLNKEVVAKKGRAIYLKNHEAIKQRHREYNKQYLQDNREMSYAKTQRRRARKKGNGVFAISKPELRKLYSSPCYYCGAVKAGHADHVVPLAKGGRHSVGNLVPACAPCNMSKGSKFLSQWRRDLLVARKVMEVL